MARPRALLFAVIVLLPACSSTPRQCADGGTPPVTDLVDPGDARATVPVLETKLVEEMAAQKPPMPRLLPVAQTDGKRPFNILVLSGGGAYGAYTAGVLAGWTASGTRPEFDVVTGVSTGALLAVLAYLGPQYDSLLKKFYTTITDDDVYEKKSDVRALLSDSFRDSKPLAKMIEAVIDERTLRLVAAQHAKGRRLYVGTTHLDARRLVVWDLGEIASRNGPGDIELFRKLLLASASIPGYFPPVPIEVTVDGKPVEELHVDGGVTASLFFRPPHVTPKERAALGDRPLEGSNVYMIVAGKLYADPGCVERRLLPIAGDSITALLYAKCRSDLFEIYALSLSTGMKYHATAVPADVEVPRDATSFEPSVMGWLYEVGREQAMKPGHWRAMPPGLQPGEEVPVRGGVNLLSQGRERPKPPKPELKK